MVRIVLMYYIDLDTFFEKPGEDLMNMLFEASESPPEEMIFEEQGLVQQ